MTQDGPLSGVPYQSTMSPPHPLPRPDQPNCHTSIPDRLSDVILIIKHCN